MTLEVGGDGWVAYERRRFNFNAMTKALLYEQEIIRAFGRLIRVSQIVNIAEALITSKGLNQIRDDHLFLFLHEIGVNVLCNHL